MNADSKEAAFQQDIIDQKMVAGGWKLGDPAKYDRKLAPSKMPHVELASNRAKDLTIVLIVDLRRSSRIKF